MNPLDQFLQEHSNLRSAECESKLTDAQERVEKSGTLLLSGCVDWDNATSKAALGLDGPHAVDLGSPVIRTYSSSSSLHLFILTSDEKLYGLGKNEHGQLSTGSTDTIYLPREIRTPWPLNQLKKITTGRSHTLFLLRNGDVYGCGSNSCGQLGLGGGARDVQDSLQMKKLPLVDIQDISCGYEHSIVCTISGAVFTFGHPQYGQLGHGATGEHLQEGKRGVQFNFVRSPEQIMQFMSSDGKTVVRADEIKIRSVHAGKNHCVAVEDWMTEEGDEKIYNRIFSWGFGGYGRLGHRGATDELIPREIATFVTDRAFPQKQIREVYCGSSYTLAISKSRHVYFCGILPNSPRGEASTYPKVEQDLYAWSTHIAVGGSTFIVVAADDACVFWGVPVAGKLGLEADKKSSASPTFVTAVSDLLLSDISCGYGHIAMIVSPRDVGSKKLSFRSFSEAVDSGACCTPSTASGKKRSAPAAKKCAEPTTTAARKKGKK